MGGSTSKFNVQDSGLRPDETGDVNEVPVIEGFCIDVIW